MQTNVVVIIIDALRADRVGTLGGRDLTPNIDSLGADSARFTNAYSTTNATDPAVTSIQTGRYPLTHGVVNHGSRVTDQEKQTIESVRQLPEVLLESGYRTGKFGRPLGRWHRRGFDQYPSSMDQSRVTEENNPTAVMRQRFGNLLRQIHPKLFKAASRADHTIRGGPEKDEIIAQYQDRSDEVVRNFESFIGGSTPFYSFIHLMDTHAPYAANPETVRSCLNEFEYRTTVPMRGMKTHPGERWSHPDSFDQLTKDGSYPEVQKRYYLPDGTPTTAITDAHYDATVRQADERVGDILDVLKDNGLYDETLIVLLSDHGESLTEHGIFYEHHGLYDVTVKVPLLVHPPNGCTEEITELVQITDVAPTIESYTSTSGLDADGYSLRPVIEDRRSIARQYVLAEEAHTQRRRMVRSANWKLVYSLDGNTTCRYCGVQHASECELYDLRKDPNETRNTAKDNESKVTNLRKHGETKAAEFKAMQPDTDGDGSVTYDDEEVVKDRLEALGYR